MQGDENYNLISQNPNMPPPTQQPPIGVYNPPVVQGGYPQPMAVGGYNPSPYQGQGYMNQPLPQPGAVPPPNFGIQYVYVPDPMTELGMSTGVLIRQEAQFAEQITGCESPNRYYVFSQSPQGGMKLLFKCKEYSGCCMRQCCPASSREFNMVIKHIANGGMLDENFSTPFVNIQKPFKCTCCCLERPEMVVTFGGTNQLCGRIKQPFSCCDPILVIHDNTGAMRYIVHGDCCQCGLCCANNFCGKLSEVDFNIYRSEDRIAPLGSIIKKRATVSELVTSADSYQVNFPQGSTPQDKLLLIVAGLMIDYQYFEESSSSDKNKNRSHHYNKI
jgi:hypothetical protein